MDYSKAYSEIPLKPLPESKPVSSTAGKEKEVWINRACPSCKSTNGFAYTNDGGSQFMCECGKIYQRFKYA
jgi:hypothetical protein